MSRSGAGGARAYRRGGVGVTAPVLSDGVSSMVPGISERSNGVTRFSHLDRLGTNARTTDAGANVIDQKRYDAFGLPTQMTNPSGSQAGFAGAYGVQEDAETGLKLMGHRYYDPGTGRFITRDPIGSGTNWYRYCDNNPLKAVDPTGLEERALTSDEAKQVQAGINQLRLSGYGKDADYLQWMLDHGRIRVDTTMQDYGQTRYENIFLNPSQLTPLTVTGKRRNSRRISLMQNLGFLVWRASILLHEARHSQNGENHYFFWQSSQKDADERKRWRQQRGYLQGWLNVARKAGGSESLIEYLEDRIAECNQDIVDYGGKP